MKSGHIAVGIAAVVLVAGIGNAFMRAGQGVAVAEENPPKVETKAVPSVEVDDLAESPDKFKGEISLKAAVARVSKSKGVFSVIDAREFEACGEVDCAKHYLPVTFSGELPKPETVVLLTGQVVKTDKGLVFEAKRVEAKKTDEKK